LIRRDKMSKKELERLAPFLMKRIREHLDKILDENTSWEHKEDDYIKMQEDLLILEKLLGETVEIKTEIVWG